MKKYALFDWDNTVRKGYTLFSWINYLCEKQIISSSIIPSLEQIKSNYNNNTISHDQYAEFACSLFAKSLTGKNKKSLENLLPDYIEKYDSTYFFKGIDLVFDLLYSKKIDIIIISGAPSFVLRQYQERFHINSIFGFEEEVIDESYTGRVLTNYGFNKAEKINDLCMTYNSLPYIAFGDSSSDLPMLNKATFPFCIGNSLSDSKFYHIQRNQINPCVLDFLEQL